MRHAGLILLPLVVQNLNELAKRYFIILPLLMLCYALLSTLNKLNKQKVILANYRIPLSEMNTEEDYQLFKTSTAYSDLVYVLHADLKCDLDHCKTIYNQDDFSSLDFIQSRPKVAILNKTIVFLLPERFAAIGKRETILANFVAGNLAKAPVVEVKKLNSWELIKVFYF